MATTTRPAPKAEEIDDKEIELVADEDEGEEATPEEAPAPEKAKVVAKKVDAKPATRTKEKSEAGGLGRFISEKRNAIGALLGGVLAIGVLGGVYKLTQDSPKATKAAPHAATPTATAEAGSISGKDIFYGAGATAGLAALGLVLAERIGRRKREEQFLTKKGGVSIGKFDNTMAEIAAEMNGYAKRTELRNLVTVDELLPAVIGVQTYALESTRDIGNQATVDQAFVDANTGTEEKLVADANEALRVLQDNPIRDLDEDGVNEEAENHAKDNGIKPRTKEFRKAVDDYIEDREKRKGTYDKDVADAAETLSKAKKVLALAKKKPGVPGSIAALARLAKEAERLTALEESQTGLINRLAPPAPSDETPLWGRPGSSTSK